MKAHFISLFLLLSLFALLPAGARGQTGVEVSGGIGLPEIKNLGIHYRMANVQLGVNRGWFRYDDGVGTANAYTGSIQYYFAGRSTVSGQNTAYVKLGFTYLRDENDTRIMHWNLLNLRVGKIIYFHRRVGLGLDAGLMRIMKERVVRKVPEERSWFNWDWGTNLPGASIYLFVRI